MKNITVSEARNNLMQRFTEVQAEAEALEAVQINVKHKTLTNRAVTGGVIGDYLGINKALYVSYTVTYPDMRVRYQRYELPAYSYSDENGQEIGSNNGLRISRTLTPSELQELVTDVVKKKREYIAELEAEFKQVKELVQERQELAEKIQAYNERVSYASELKFKEA
mgnify:CR=1 FL=1